MPWLGSRDDTQRTAVPVNGTVTLSPVVVLNDSVRRKSPPV